MVRRIVLGAIVLAALAVAAPFLVPLSGFVPDVERSVSRALGQPVAIGELDLHLVPSPRVAAKNIRVGRGGAAKIERLEIVPDLRALLEGRRELRIRADGVALKEAALGIPAAMPRGGGGGGVAVRRVELLKVRLDLPSMRLPELDLVLELAPGEGLRRARVFSRTGELALDITPRRAGAKEVRVGVDGRVYGGTLKAAASIERTQGWHVSGKAELEGVDLVPLQRALGRAARLSGKLQAEATFDAQGASAGELRERLALDGPFEVLDGAYRGVDLAELKSLPVGDIERGGTTRFRELRGVLQLRGRELRLRELCVRSPVLAASGHVTIAADERLSGKLDVSIAKSGGFVGVPVALSGRASEPSVSLTTAGKIGAVIGTVLLPGLGTALGVSAGGKLAGKVDCG